jgi:hypothetical protein
MEKIRIWKSELETKGLKVNVGKTKVMKCTTGFKVVEEDRGLDGHVEFVVKE